MTEIKSKKPLIVTKSFRLIDFHIFDENPEKLSDSESDSNSDSNDVKKYSKSDELQFIIQMFGVNETGETCCFFIQDFQPFFYIKVGTKWNKNIVNLLLQDIKSKITDKRFCDSILDAELVEKHKLYGFTSGKKDNFVKITFKNTVAMNKVKNLWCTYIKDKDGNDKRVHKKYIFQYVSLELYESNIPPLLRYFHINNISPSGWVSIQTNRVIKPVVKTTTCKYEYICNSSNLKPLNDKETRVPYKICSFDIEASSSHGDFPLPIKTYKRLTTNIVDIFIKQMEFLDNKKSKVLIQKIILTAFGYDKFEDVDIVYPKKMPDIEQLKSRIKILVDESIEKVKKANTEEDNSKLLTIDSIFEKMKDTQLQAGQEDGDDDTEEQVEEVSYSYKKS